MQVQQHQESNRNMQTVKACFLTKSSKPIAIRSKVHEQYVLFMFPQTGSHERRMANLLC